MSLPNTASLGAGSKRIFLVARKIPRHITHRRKIKTHLGPLMKTPTRVVVRVPSLQLVLESQIRPLHTALIPPLLGVSSCTLRSWRWKSRAGGCQRRRGEETVQSEAALMRRDGGQSAPAERASRAG